MQRGYVEPKMSLNSITFRQAVTEDAKVLSDLAFRSKAYWGYSPEFMDACVDELTVLPADIKGDEFFIEVAWLQTKVIGFYSLEPVSPEQTELGAMFLEPDFIGQGIGNLMMERAKQKAKSMGNKTLHIQGDPNAQRFYEAAGAVQVGFKPSESIPGRLLPLFELDLDQ